MKFIVRLGLLTLLLITSLPAWPQVDFIEVVTKEDMHTAMKKADDGMLMLFVDVYATWCGPCKMMDREVYSNATVGEYMNAHFVNVRLDGESDFGRLYAAEQGLQGYPTMFVFGDDGEFLTSISGFRPVEELLISLKGVVDNYAVLKRYRSDYNLGIISYDDHAAYINLSREMGNEELAKNLASEYVIRQMGEELTDADIMAIAHYTDLYDSWWPEFTTGYKRVKRILGEDYIPALEQIYNNTLVMAIDSGDIGVISRLANELSPLVEAESQYARDLRSLPFLQYYYYTGQYEELISYVDQRYATDRKDDHRWLFEMASQIIDMDQQYQTEEIIEKGESWFKICIELEEHYDYYFYYGMTLFFKQENEDALQAFNRARELAVSPDQQKMVDQVLDYVRARMN